MNKRMSGIIAIDTLDSKGESEDVISRYFRFRVRLPMLASQESHPLFTGPPVFSKEAARRSCAESTPKIVASLRQSGVFSREAMLVAEKEMETLTRIHLGHVEASVLPEKETQLDRLRASLGTFNVDDLRPALEDMWEHPPTMSLVRKDGYPACLALQSGSEKSGVVFSVENAREVLVHWKNVGKISDEQFEDLFSRLATFEGDDPASSISGPRSIFDRIVDIMSILSATDVDIVDAIPTVLCQVLKTKHLDPRWVFCDCGYHAWLYLAGIRVFDAMELGVARHVNAMMRKAFDEFMPDDNWVAELEDQVRRIFNRQDADAVPETRPSRPAEGGVDPVPDRDEELAKVADRVLAEELGEFNPVGTPAETSVSTDSADGASVDASVESKSV